MLEIFPSTGKKLVVAQWLLWIFSSFRNNCKYLWRPTHWPEVDHATASPSGWSLGITRWLHTWWEVTYFQIVMVRLIHWIGLDWIGKRSQIDWQRFANNWCLISKSRLTRWNHPELVCTSKHNSSAMHLFTIGDSTQLVVCLCKS